MKRLTVLQLLFLLALPAVVHAAGTVFYATASGPNTSCSAATSQTTPIAGFANGARCLGQGDKLVLVDGTYSECLLNVIPAGLSASQPTVVQALHKRKAVINGSGIPCNNAAIQIGARAPCQNCGNQPGDVRSYITIDGLFFDMPISEPIFAVKPQGGIEDGVVRTDGSVGMTFINNEVRGGINSGNTSSFTLGFSQGGNEGFWTVSGNWVHDLGMNNVENAIANGGAFSYAFYCSGHDNVIENNEFGPNVSGYGIHFYGGGDRYNNIVRNNYFHDILSPSIILCGHDNQIYNNIIAHVGDNPYHGSYTGGMLIGGSCSGVQGNNNLIYNNTFVRNDSYASTQPGCLVLGVGTGTSANNNIVRNNICWNNGPSGPGDTIYQGNGSGNTIDHNLCQGTGCSVYGDPQFAKNIPAGNLGAAGIQAVDFQPSSSSSPLVNAGTGTGLPSSTDYGGATRDSSPDIGAWEFGGGPPPPPTHNACVANVCTSVTGAGTDQCTTLGTSCGISQTTFSAMHWPLDEGTGLSAADSTNNGITGTLSASPNTPTWIAGKVGNGALRFVDGPTLVTNAGATWTPNQAVTVTFWILARGCLNGCGTFNVGAQDSPNRFMAHVPWSDNVLYWDYGSTTANGRISTDFTAYMGKWTFVALVSNGSNFKAIYLNGVIPTGASSATAMAPGVSLTGLELGRLWTGGSAIYYANADIDDFAIINQVLTAQQIQQMYNGGRRASRHPTSEGLR